MMLFLVFRSIFKGCQSPKCDLKLTLPPFLPHSAHCDNQDRGSMSSQNFGFCDRQACMESCLRHGIKKDNCNV